MITEREVTDELPETDIGTRQLTPLLDSIGSPDFVEALMTLAHGRIGADFVSIFCQGDRDSPILVGTTCRLGKRRAEQAAAGYAQHFTEDRNSQLLSEEQAPGDYLTIQEASALASFTYRRDCYDLPGISGRISLVRRRPTYGISVSFYSSCEAGPFAETLYEPAAALLGLAVSATQRHVAFSLKGTVWKQQDVQTRLALTYPGLTRREREVAAMAIKGRTAAETAEILGISETTVITHRKKAYKRMSVSSLRQLMAG